MKLLVLDFEAKDPYLSLGLGAGWVFALKVSTSLFRVLGFSLSIYDTETGTATDPVYLPIDYAAAEPRVLTEGWLDIDTGQTIGGPQFRSVKRVLFVALRQCDFNLIGHNLTYELGCLRVLGFTKTDLDKLTLYDTVTIAKLHDNTLTGYDLSTLSKLFLKKEDHKGTDLLIDKVIELGLVPEPKRKDYNIENYRTKCRKFAYQNLDILQERATEIVAAYCNLDVQGTAQLFKYLIGKKEVSLKQASYWSQFQRICVWLREKGIKVDLEALNKGIELLTPEVQVLRDKFYSLYPGNKDFDLDSPKQLAEALKKVGYDLPKSDKGNESTNARWLEDNVSDPLIQSILEYRNTSKILHDFFIKVKEMQNYTCPEALVDGAKYGYIYPEYNLFGAVVTGRFSSTKPNIQQQPKKGKWGALVRNIFIPKKEGNLFFSADWKQQEPRLQVHYANLINAPGAKEMVRRYEDNAELDMHQTVADLAKISKSEAKPINLGLVYGMGFYSLMMNLGFSKEKTEDVLTKYYKAVPYVKYLINRCSFSFKKNNCISTLGKRKLKRWSDKYDYKAISGLIQGSGADMMYTALLRCYQQHIPIIAVIHDEICFEGNLETARKVRHIMENTHPKLTVPMRIDLKAGSSWGRLEPVDLDHKLDKLEK